MTDLNTQIDKVHVRLLEEENLTFDKLPKPLKDKIRGWNLLFKRLERNPEDEKLLRSVQKQSIEIADKIQDFIEDDFEDDNKPDDNKPDDNKPNDNKPDDNKPDDNKPDDNKPNDNKPNDNKPDDNKPPVNDNTKGFGTIPMAKKIQMKIDENRDGRISESDLKAIIGKEPDYPEQQVHNLTLRKVFLASDYRLV